MMYDYLIVGAGLYGATFARRMTDAGCRCLVIDRRDHIAGNVYTERIEGVNVHRYGAHIFHTNDREVWDFVNKYALFNRFTNSPVANYKGEIYSLPFNMYTFNQMWGVVTPEEAHAKIEEQRRDFFNQAINKTGQSYGGSINPGTSQETGYVQHWTPRNLEEQAISLVGRDIYEKLVKGYTEKQWGRKCTELPAFIIKRLPVRFTYDNNYFNALYQGIPVGGYTGLVKNMLEGIDTELGVDYLKNKAKYDSLAPQIIYTGAIDEYFGYSLGHLEYRSVRFENEILDIPNFQGNAAVNYTDAETPWTRIIEHKWFEFGRDEQGKDIPKTVISREYSSEWKPGDEPYYPVNDEKNTALYNAYKKLAEKQAGVQQTINHAARECQMQDQCQDKALPGKRNIPRVIFGGRLGQYKYFDMDQVIRAAIDMAEKTFLDN